MVSKLDLYILNNDNSVAPFPSEAEQIVLYDFTFEAPRMGSAPEITSTIKANGSLENYLTTKVFCEHNGERYYLKNLPSSSKENTDPQYTFDLTFVSERTILDNVYMVDAVQGDGNIDRYQSNSANIMFTGTIEELVGRLNASMDYAGVGYSVVLDEGITTESKLVSFQDKFFTEALQEGVKIFNIPYYFVGKVIHFGWAQNTIPTLRYGDGLLSINRSIRTERIVNRATATGSSENIPHYYPNPTPKGFITPIITDNSGAGISVVNEAKLSRLDENQKLAYYEFNTVNITGTWFTRQTDYQSPEPYIPIVNWDEQSTSGIVKSVGGVNAWLVFGILINSTQNSIADADVTYYLSYQTPRITNRYIKFVEIVAYTRDGDSLVIEPAISASISDGGVIVENGSNSGQGRGDYVGDDTSSDENTFERGDRDNSETYVGNAKLSIELGNLPTNRDIYVAVRYRIQDTSNKYELKFNFQSNNYLTSGWYVSDGNGRISDSDVDIFNYGISTSNTPKEGDEVSYSVIKKIPFATTLMPSIYRESNGERRFYNATNGAYDGITFENEYSKENPKEAIIKFEVKPTIVGVTNANGERIDMFAEFAYDLNDSDETEKTDESSESFIHPYFYAKLRKINGDNGFNLFAQAIETGEMTIEMTSGHCGACKFVIAVDKNTQRNLVMVDDNGDLIYDDTTGKVKMANDATGLDRQNDTQNYEVWIALKKDINTFGTVMPMANSTIKPSVDDTFVITNILLPQAYFSAAEKKLEDEIIAFLAKNNTFQFDYGINFSRIFLKKRNDVFSKLTENSIIPIEYNGNKLSFYVSSYTYRKQKGEVLPEISVSLTDNFDSTPSAFQQSISAIQENIVKGIGAVGLTFEDTDPRYLRKDVADIVKERTTFEKGLDFGGSLYSKGFKKGDLIGAGFGVYTDEDGNSVVEADRMVIRKDAKFSEIVINQTTFQRDTTVFSGGGCNITDVEEVEGAYRCYYDNKSGTRFSGFIVGDQARCQRFDESQNGIIKYYWRVVVAVGENYVDLSTTDVDGAGAPEAGDDIVQFGNRTDDTRQSVIVIASNPKPAILQYVGVNSFDLPEPVTKISPNDNEFTGKLHIEAGSTGLAAFDDLPQVISDVANTMEFGKYNLLRNSGFTGDYTSNDFQSAENISNTTNVYSKALKYWDAKNAITQASDYSKSGIEVVLTDGSLSQALIDAIVVGDSYIFSIYAKGDVLDITVNGVKESFSLTSSYERYIVRLKATSDNAIINIVSQNATICMPQMERGSVISAWGLSIYDNDRSLAYFQTLQYISSAIKDGSVDIIGGLILANILLLGNYQDGEMREVTSGISGVYNKPDDVALWAGGSLEMAIRTVNRFRQNPNYMPANEDWSEMAKYVTTHGGDTFMRGYIYALGGYFRGMVDIANGKIRLNTDGSGHFANRNISWDEDGRVQKTSPDSIIWTNVLAYSGTNHIDYSKGAYLDLKYSDGQLDKDIFTLENGKFDGFTIIVKGTPVASDNEKSAILSGIFIMPNGDTVSQIKASYIVNGISIEALGDNTPVWRVKAPYYEMKDDVAIISDVREAVTKVIRIRDADNLNHTMTFENGILVEDDVRCSEI